MANPNGVVGRRAFLDRDHGPHELLPEVHVVGSTPCPAAGIVEAVLSRIDLVLDEHPVTFHDPNGVDNLQTRKGDIASRMDPHRLFPLTINRLAVRLEAERRGQLTGGADSARRQGRYRQTDHETQLCFHNFFPENAHPQTP